MDRLTPYAYRTAPTPLHRLGALRKLLALLALSVVTFAFGIPGLIAATAVIAAAAASARLSPRRLFAGVKPLLAATIVILVARSISVLPGRSFAASFSLDRAGLREGTIFALSVLAAFAGGALLFATTTTAELRDSIGTVEGFLLSPLSRFLRRFPFSAARRAAARLDRANLALVISLTLGFLPRVFEVWEAAEEARLARSGRRGIAGTAAMIPLVIERLMELAAETARAMEVRGAALARDLPAKDQPAREAKMRASRVAAAGEE